MPAKLIITKKSDPSWQHEREFSKEIITIGRGSSNTLLLEDPKKIVSRKHAQIKYNENGYQLIDCDSHNFTYLNNQKIARQVPCPLKNGDQIRIGEFLLSYQQVHEPENNDGSKIFSPESASNGEARPKTLTEIMLGIAPESSMPLRIGQAMEMMMDLVVKLAKSGKKFRDDYVGIDVSGGQKSLHKMSVDELKEFLLNDEIPEEEAQNRFEVIRKQIEEYLLQTEALMDVHRISVDEGTQRLLNSLDPEKLTNEFSTQGYRLGFIKIPYRLVPGGVKRKVNRFIRQRLLRIVSEDRAVLNSNAFRPLFRNSYLAAQAKAEKEKKAENNS